MTDSHDGDQFLAMQPRPNPLTTLSLRAIYERELTYVWSTLRRLGVRAADLEDASHEVFVVVQRRLADYDESRALRPWLFGIAYRIASEFRRRTKRQSEVELEDVATQHSLQDDALGRAQDRALILTALEAVEIDRRAVFILHDIDGTAVPEIAHSLGIPLNTAYSRLRLARAEFAKAVMKLRGPQ